MSARLEATLEALRNCALFEGLSDSTLTTLAQGCVERSYAAQDHLFHEHDPAGTMFIIQSGQVSIERNRFEGDHEDLIQIAIRRPGDVIGEFTLFQEMPRTANARCVVKTQVLMLQGRYIVDCLRRDDKLALNIIRALCGKLVEAMNRKSDQETESVRTRLVREIIDLGRQMGKAAEDGTIEINGKITQQELANRIGCTREVINRTLSEIGRDVVESKNGRLTILQPKALKRLARG